MTKDVGGEILPVDEDLSVRISLQGKVGCVSKRGLSTSYLLTTDLFTGDRTSVRTTVQRTTKTTR